MDEPTLGMNIRSVPESAAALFRRSARARGLTQAEYLERLLELHARMREEVHPALADVGLEAVTL